MKPIPLEEFRAYAKNHNVVPVAESFLADSETPLTLYAKLAGHRENTFLLESAEHGGAWSRYSFIGVYSEAVLTEVAGVSTWLGRPPAGAPTGIDPLEALRITSSHLRAPRIAGLPRLTSGLVGYMGYDAVRRLESIPSKRSDPLALPEIAFMLTTDLAIFDHLQGTVTLIANAINWNGSDDGVDEAYAASLKRLDEMRSALRDPIPSAISHIDSRPAPNFKRLTESKTYVESVERIKEEIRSGEAFQVVLSQRFEMECQSDPFDVYRMLRLHNPSPYMYLFRFKDGLSIVGSSPEALVKVTDGEVMVHPIAGTRKRSLDQSEDVRLGEELLSDPKERAEHLMLVDLGRNDLGRVCKSGSVKVVEFMQLERYSHVMHIVSTVLGELGNGKIAIDALYSVFPAGTLSGAPKPRAMEIIEDHEPFRRGIYGGAIGYVDFTGNLDTCIAIRTAIIKEGRAYVQAGAGIVADSIPLNEEEECRNKAAAVLGAIAAANNLRALS
ncbi:MAG: anthranilate synthase component I [Actinobacteria bacterium]|nr:anthranilate synthase component I [Actinomycetota bacterium]NDE83246.1 anthranilate synthase component I [Actinomycetota bacterium]